MASENALSDKTRYLHFLYNLLNAWYVMEQSITDSVINEWRMILQACWRLKEEFLSKCFNDINNWLNQQHYYVCELKL